MLYSLTNNTHSLNNSQGTQILQNLFRKILDAMPLNSKTMIFSYWNLWQNGYLYILFSPFSIFIEFQKQVDALLIFTFLYTQPCALQKLDNSIYILPLILTFIYSFNLTNIFLSISVRLLKNLCFLVVKVYIIYNDLSNKSMS